VSLGEAYTQEWARKFLSDKSNVRVPVVGTSGFIVMEYIKGSTCDASRVTRVAAALTSLLDTKVFDQSLYYPGPVGPNDMKHPLFEGGVACCTYKTANGLDIHMNGVIVHRSS
jgi:hypothetical protein